MVSICRTSATNEARLVGDRFNVITVANASRRRQRQYGLVDYGRPPSSSWSTPLSSLMFMPTRQLIRRLRAKNRQLGQERLLDVFGIGCGQTVFSAKNPMRPICRFLWRTDVLQFGG